eukprot:SAG22_NODE_537_length_9361_cov_53.700821_10_plen_72_part_00
MRAQVAAFARYSPGIDKAELGQYLGGAGSTKASAQFNKDVLKEYVLTFDFGATELAEAVRIFLESFLVRAR